MEYAVTKMKIEMVKIYGQKCQAVDENRFVDCVVMVIREDCIDVRCLEKEHFDNMDMRSSLAFCNSWWRLERKDIIFLNEIIEIEIPAYTYKSLITWWNSKNEFVTKLDKNIKLNISTIKGNVTILSNNS